MSAAIPEGSNQAADSPRSSWVSKAMGLLGLFIGLLALGTPLLPDGLAFPALGLAILVTGLLQNATGLTFGDPQAANTWISRGGGSILTGLLLIAMPKLTFTALVVLLGLSWIVSGASEVIATLRHDQGRPDRFWSVIDGLVNVLLGVTIAVQWPVSGFVSLGVFVGLRYFSSGWSLFRGAAPLPVAEATSDGHPDRRLGLPQHPYFQSQSAIVTRELEVSSRSDRYWRSVFLITFFAIHVARMNVDWTLVGMLSPAGAVAGDAALAMVLAYGLIAPMSVSWRTMTRRIERRAWTWYLDRFDRRNLSWRSTLVSWWLLGRWRGSLQRTQSRGSPTAIVGWGLQRGLPLAAILMAVVPLWGVSWFFNTETWVTAAWETWSERRTDHWREAMVRAVQKHGGDAAQSPDFFRVFPDGVSGASDFSFVVIGDTGEGDASQHVLRNQLLLAGRKPEVKFLVVSSDVIYPLGSMKDYEPKFYLPFNGFHQPIFAVPGNHDWYDALEAFGANFFEPEAARTALRARRETDLRLTSTTEARINNMIDEAARLRREYQVQAGLQRAPYFELHGDIFSLIVVDTGILRRIDKEQRSWLEAALRRSRDRFKMVVLGHPLFAAGLYQGGQDQNFAQIHHLLKQHAVDVVMGGDTHDFEYYREPYDHNGRNQSMFHFVNGGGGAYLSIGTALNWPAVPPTPECGYYPRSDALTASLDASTPFWKWPLWYWVKSWKAWPSSPEAVASAFDYDQAPYFQSFVEVRVEGSLGQVRIWPYGVNGRLRWRELEVHPSPIRGAKSPDEFVEFTFPLRAGTPSPLTSFNPEPTATDSQRSPGRRSH